MGPWSYICKVQSIYQNKLTLIHCGLVTPYDDKDLGQHWLSSGNGLLPGGTKPLPEPMLTYHQ